MHFRKLHPNLYLSLMAKAILSLVVGILFLTGNEKYLVPSQALDPSPSIPYEFWGVLMTVVAVLMILGITNGSRRYRFAAWGMILGTGVGSIFAFGYTALFLEDKIETINAPLLWLLYTVKMIIWSKEPTFNPVASTLGQNALNERNER